MLPQFVNIVSNFIIPVLIIEAFGSQINGLVTTVRSIISYISLVGAGITVAVVQSLYAPVAQKDENTVRGMLRATNDMFNKSGYIYLIIVLLVSFIYPLLVEGDISFTTKCLLLLVMSISGASEFFVVGRCRSLLYASQKVYVCTTVQAFSLLFSLILAVIMLKFGANIVFVQLAISVVYVMRAFLLSYYVRKNYPQYVKINNVRPIKSAVSKRNEAMVHQLSGLFIFGSQSIILSMMVGLEAASIYSVYNIIFSGLAAICGNLNTAITPFIGRTFAISSIDKVRREFNVIEFVYFIITSIIFAVTSVTILPFVSIYTNAADIDYKLPLFALLFTISQLFNIFRQPYSTLINVAGHFKETRNRAIIESILCIGFSIIFTYTSGIYGVLIGTGIALFWRCLDMLYYCHKHILHNSIKVSVFRLVGVISIVLFVYFFVSKDKNLSNFFQWTTFALEIFLLVACILILVIAVFERKSLQMVLSYIK